MSVTEITSAQAPRRVERMPGPRAIGLLVALYAAMQGWIFWREFPLDSTRIAAGCLVASVAAVAALTIRWPRRWLAFAGLALAGGQLWYFSRALERTEIPAHLKSTAAGSIMVLAAAILAMLLVATGRVRASRALALSLALSGAGWGANALWSAWRPDLVGDLPPPPFRTEGMFSGIHGNPEFGYRLGPNQRFRSWYPSNPRGYFHTRPALVAEDGLRWKLRCTEGGEVRLQRVGEQNEVARFEIRKRMSERSYDVMATADELPIVAGERYQFSLRIRADARRPARLTLSTTRPRTFNLGLNAQLELTPEWQDVSLEFRAGQNDRSAVLSLELGEADAAVEVARLSMVPLEGRLDMQRWKARFLDQVWGSFEAYRPESRALALRVLWSDRQRPGSAQLYYRGLSLVRDAGYRLEFWARSDAPRWMPMSIHREHDVGQSLGLQQGVQVDTAWRAFSIPFIATDTADGELQLMFGDRAGRTEISDVAVLADRPEHRLVPLRHYVETRTNSLGYRDDERPIEARPGVFRIVCLGDSCTYGTGVHEQDRFSNRLEKLLNATVTADGQSSSGPRYEVLNFGHSGYNTRQERLCYELEAAPYRPQLVVVAMVDNDDIAWKDEQKLPGYQTPTQVERLFAPLGARRKQSRHQRPRRFDVCLEELTLLKQRCDADGVRLAVMIFPNRRSATWDELSRTISAGLKPLNIPLLDLHGALFSQHQERDLWVHVDDLHPNELAHHVAADELANFLRQQNLLAASPVTPPVESKPVVQNPADVPAEAAESAGAATMN